MKLIVIGAGPAGAAAAKTAAHLKAEVVSGSAPLYPPPLDRIRGEILDSDRVFEMNSIPKSMAVIGGGAVGCEFACLFHELGCRITLIEKTGSLLPGEDAQVVQFLR